MKVTPIKYGPNKVYTEKEGNRYETHMVKVVLNGYLFKMGYCEYIDTLFVTDCLGVVYNTGVIESDKIDFPGETQYIKNKESEQ